jgi:hypothetical protein
MTARIWIEPVRRPDDNWYTDCGLLLRTRLGDPDGEVLYDRLHNAICETFRRSCRESALSTWKVGIGSPCMTGDIAITAGLTVHEPDDGVVHFARWRPFDQHAVSRSVVPSSAGGDQWGR